MQLFKSHGGSATGCVRNTIVLALPVGFLVDGSLYQQHVLYVQYTL
jgi:hypothetical protein